LLHYVVRSGSLVTGGGTNKGFNNNILLTPMKRWVDGASASRAELAGARGRRRLSRRRRRFEKR